MIMMWGDHEKTEIPFKDIRAVRTQGHILTVHLWDRTARALEYESTAAASADFRRWGYIQNRRSM